MSLNLFAKLIVALIDLMQAEMTTVKRTSFRWVLSIVMIAAAVLMVMLGILMLDYALYLLLGAAGLPWPASAFISAGALLLVAAPAFVVAVWLNRRD
jgi:hypothetical protein